MRNIFLIMALGFAVASILYDQRLISVAYLIVITGIVEKEKRNNSELRDAAIKLRQAQRAYMNERGNKELGKSVGMAAEALDDVLLKS